ncbi:MAG: Exodeoxyribonuclease 7 large subunit [Candidatus Uhrbacteria bacterium GW2011_GWE2_45_35]|uniref:Exodeoxyribonuclease 7 large subunit n=2 Tax=Candidatus Uhriibacteriota TaxID=1752732 RepID=A0A0G1JD94_9BACT|nr:MAG: Exodeoxyribonuclease 7 large subunit [Candidatus Uhrbacteria bacterium GW2011_GWF2_44_350]KKU07715.1 MAG: Exodeoxyribonuclease 7 large subunit [Candidatus Uhrbacteria bacterium GW2011_GWE2_45_35]HBR81000.1 exodeoxyribonuclease VII large subunit [Candidatus Uhrbacteria bacterium]HCU31403.1 exodeoxyribonuclease VII large subunit [Candidatus Uhrbacteria bacterium]
MSTPEIEPVLQVSEYLKLANQVLKLNIDGYTFAIEGEIFDYKIKDGKWIMFSLKDENDPAAKVGCFATTFKVSGVFEDGMRVKVWGPPAITKWSNFQIDVQKMEAVGDGTLKRAYELLKKKLEAEGLFDFARKRELPRFPSRIGLITSRDAAAYGDFNRILNNRWSGVEVLFIHVHVQGREAVPEILAAFERFNLLPEKDRPEVLVLTRGGGSLEDLHAFNDEQVARAVFGSRIPVVCGVGHERDESLCDFVADVRASTPSNAAERAVPNRLDVIFEIETMTRQIESRLLDTLSDRQNLVDRVTQLIFSAADLQKEKFERLAKNLFDRVNTWLPRLSERLNTSVRVLASVDPKRVLERGYGIVTKKGRVIKDAAELEIGADIAVQLSHGTFDAEVLRVNGKGKMKLV